MSKYCQTETVLRDERYPIEALRDMGYHAGVRVLSAALRSWGFRELMVRREPIVTYSMFSGDILLRGFPCGPEYQTTVTCCLPRPQRRG